MLISIKDEIKEEAKRIHELIKEDKSSVNLVSNISLLVLIMNIFGFIFFVLNLYDILWFVDVIRDRLAAILLMSIFYVFFMMLFSFNLQDKITNKIKNTVSKSNLKSLSRDYIVGKKKRAYFYNKYNNLKEYSKIYLSEEINYNKEFNIEKIEKKLSKIYIENKDYKDFINYLKIKNKDKEVVLPEVFIQYLIYNKIKDYLKEIEKKEDFYLEKENIIFAIDLLKDENKKLEILYQVEKIEDKHNEKSVTDKIIDMKNKVLNKPNINKNIIKSI